ncbi:DUF3093 domain-containing protein [Microbacterium amylolyticum]|uniref:DUF3093 domain-containing protein n=1 Tax=Microbacterium amylolyticum TaxID=936337 RepID=UPI0013EA551A|nr:DUF3093 domain-containing protein [Microbacterium amylolyticum]
MNDTESTGRPVPVDVTYRERLTPSLWILAGATIIGPMLALVFVQLDGAIALGIGAAASIALVAALVISAPRVSVEAGELRAGRAHIAVDDLGEPRALMGDEARHARTAGIDHRGWYLIRGGIAGAVVVPNTDPDDPVTSWTISTRTPDRLAAAILRAQSTIS